ncbi:hypothetical protein SBD_5774 [Streptomyces bottropensis ATCC 25435]|uniref:Uncharacterized protein n=1 Tax=Streptomyces bottropensis ATCC 25435 TaxID=1054862 RepID=M3FKX3_9ACTN|nr:hypothetical protein SBD_5774 [Streptomyces bottropensis ATCC 25435]
MAAIEAWGCAHGVHLNDVRGPAPGGWERALVVGVRRRGAGRTGRVRPAPRPGAAGMRP